MIKKSLFLLISFIHILNPLNADPWGKDADLAIPKLTCEVKPIIKCQTPVFGPIAEAVIGFHKSTITHCDGPRSNFRPNSSGYMLGSIRKYGFFKGFTMGCDRLMRENADPWIYRTIVNEDNKRMKWDPVP